MNMTNLAEATAAHLGGVAGIGVEVGSDADLARAVAAGFNVKAIDALRQSGVTGGELGTLVIKPRTLSHRRTNGGRLMVDRAARVARGRVRSRRSLAAPEPRRPRRAHADGPATSLPPSASRRSRATRRHGSSWTIALIHASVRPCAYRFPTTAQQALARGTGMRPEPPRMFLADRRMRPYVVCFSPREPSIPRSAGAL